MDPLSEFIIPIRFNFYSLRNIII